MRNISFSSYILSSYKTTKSSFKNYKCYGKEIFQFWHECTILSRPDLRDRGMDVSETIVSETVPYSAFTSCQHAATKPHPCNTSHNMFTSVLYSLIKLFQHKSSSHYQRGSVYQESLELLWVMSIRQWVRACHLISLQFIIERSRLPLAQSYF